MDNVITRQCSCRERRGVRRRGAVKAPKVEPIPKNLGRPAPATQSGVDGYGDQQDCSGGDVGSGGADVEQGQSVGEGGDDETAQERVNGLAVPAEQAGAPDDGRSNRVEDVCAAVEPDGE